jgi:hypothetical protein
MEDRMFRGFVAGLIGGVVSSVLTYLSYFLGFTTLRLPDWASILMYAHTPPFSLEELMFSTFIYICWCGAVGSVFAYFLLRVTSRMIYFKGWVLGTTPYFLVYLFTTFFQIPGTAPTPFNTAFSDYIASTIFGLVMAYSFKVLDQATVQRHSPLELLAHPAAKRIDEETSRYRLDNDQGDGT